MRWQNNSLLVEYPQLTGEEARFLRLAAERGVTLAAYARAAERSRHDAKAIAHQLLSGGLVVRVQLAPVPGKKGRAPSKFVASHEGRVALEVHDVALRTWTRRCTSTSSK